MDFSKILGLPFLAREQLKFGRGAKFELVVVSQGNTTVTLSVRSVDKEGISKFGHTVASTGQLTTSIHPITDVPLAVSIKDDVGDLIQGDVYVTVSLRINSEIVHELASGFVYSQKALTFPVSNGNDSMPGRGRIREVSVTSGGVGEEISQSVPAGRIWHILAVSGTFVCGAGVANRRVRLLLGGNSGFQVAAVSDQDQAASQQRTYHFAQYGVITDSIDGSFIQVGLPQNIYLPESGNITTDTTNFQADETWSNIRILIEEFFKNVD